MKRIRLSKKAQGLGFIAYAMNDNENVRIQAGDTIIDIETSQGRASWQGASNPVVSVKCNSGVVEPEAVNVHECRVLVARWAATNLGQRRTP